MEHNKTEINHLNIAFPIQTSSLTILPTTCNDSTKSVLLFTYACDTEVGFWRLTS